MITAKSIGCALLGAVFLVASAACQAQDWPNRPVKDRRSVRGGRHHRPDGTSRRRGALEDLQAAVLRREPRRWRRRRRCVQVARADPDGYTLMIGGYGPHIFAPATTANLGYDALSDFTHIAMIGGESFIIVAHPALGVKSFADLTALARRSHGTAQHGLPRSVDARRAGRRAAHPQARAASEPQSRSVSRRRTGHDRPARQPRLAWAASCCPLPSSTSVPARSCRWRLISTERAPALQELPTIVELGHPDIGGAIWSWLAGPKDLPAAMVARLNQEVRRSLQAPEAQAAVRTRPVPVDGRRRSDAQRLHCRRVEALDHVLSGIRAQAAVGLGCNHIAASAAALSCFLYASMISWPVANHTFWCDEIYSSARSRYLIRCGTPIRNGCSAMPMTRGAAFALLVEHVEAFANPAMEIRDVDRRHVEQRHVVQLDGIGNGIEPVVHAVGQIVVDPVADIFDAVIAQQIEGLERLGEARPEPAAHLLAETLDDRLRFAR